MNCTGKAKGPPAAWGWCSRSRAVAIGLVSLVPGFMMGHPPKYGIFGIIGIQNMI